MMTAGNLVAAKEQIHKIKGASGNIGAVQLYNAAATLEAECEGQHLMAAFRRFREIFKQTMAVIATLQQPENVPSDSGGNIEALQAIATELDQLLDENDFISEALLNTFKTHLALEQLDLFVQLHRYINELRYDKARRTLRQLTELPDIQETL